MRLSLAEIVDAVDGTLLMPDQADSATILNLSLTSVVQDSRQAISGSLFVALPGERVDGHAFAGAAVKVGAGAILAQHNPFPNLPPVPIILTENSVLALGKLAHAWRNRAAELQKNLRVIGVTGTAGKTTVKEMLSQVLAQRWKTAKNQLNLNNQIGLPLSILATDGTEEMWVMEAGISHPQDMDELAGILNPDVGLILNVGSAHTEWLGDRGVAHYKSRLFAHLTVGGVAIASADYPDLVREARAIRPDMIFFSTTGRQVEYRSAYIGSAGTDRSRYRLWLSGESLDVEAPLRGNSGAENVLAVATVAHQLGMSGDQIAKGLSEVVLPSQRFACVDLGAWIVIDDSYNANPLSMNRALDSANEMATHLEASRGRPSPLICVLGEMGELGSIAEAEHERLGRKLAELKVRAVLWKGKFREAVENGLQEGSFNGAFLPLSQDQDFLSGLATLASQGLRGGVVLFKGSRVNRLEELVRIFLDRAEQAREKKKNPEGDANAL